MAALLDSARELIESGALAHLVTLNQSGAPQVSCHQKIKNVERDPRVSASFEGTRIQPPGLKEYLVVHGRARITEGGAAELLQRLAHVYLGPHVTFPAMPDPPPGFVLHIAIERIGGVGPWNPR